MHAVTLNGGARVKQMPRTGPRHDSDAQTDDASEKRQEVEMIPYAHAVVHKWAVMIIPMDSQGVRCISTARPATRVAMSQGPTRARSGRTKNSGEILVAARFCRSDTR